MDDPTSWTDHAACRGRLELFFPAHGERPPARERREAQARRVCRACPVQGPCRALARARGELGLWGGETEDERAEAGFPAAPAPATARRAGAVAG